MLITRLADNHRTRTVTDALQTMVADLPRAVYSTITWDQGAQMADHAAPALATDIKVYFADPHSPRSASHQREHRRPDPRVLPQGHQLQQHPPTPRSRPSRTSSTAAHEKS